MSVFLFYHYQFIETKQPNDTHVNDIYNNVSIL